MESNKSKIKVCPICKEKFKLYSNSQKFCSFACRETTYKDYRTDQQRKERAIVATKADPNKVQCLICSKWYVQVGTHIVQVHGMTCREYRVEFDLEVKRGIVPLWYRKQKGDQSLENKTYLNLKKGKKHWYVKGDKKAGHYKRSPITLERLKELHKKKINATPTRPLGN